MQTRDQIDSSYQWNLESIYSTPSAWKEDFAALEWKAIASFKGRLGEGAETLQKAFLSIHGTQEKLEKLYIYASHRHDEDIANPLYQELFSKAFSRLSQFQQEIAWFEPELLHLPEDQLNAYVKSPLLSAYRHLLKKIIRLKPHTLSEKEEELLALSAEPLQKLHQAFSALSDADLPFPQVLDSEKKEHPLTHGSYQLYLRSKDRSLRQNAFLTYHGAYASYQNTFCQLLQGQIQRNFFLAKARRYDSCLEAALTPHQIPVSVYSSLIEAVNARLSSLHRYVELRKKMLHLDAVRPFDLSIPLIQGKEPTIPYQKALELITASVKPLGDTYQKALIKGLHEEKWVDQLENKNKRSGAYSGGCYGTYPFILMNYKELPRDVMTLAHEAGHSMHSYFTRKAQPYYYGDYPIFVAEVASTFNEELLFQEWLKQTTDRDERLLLLNQKIDDIRATLFRQTQFAEFELFLHEQVEKGEPLTPTLLAEAYQALNQKYYGPSYITEGVGAFEWARIPHFYYNFYVYQYATGISAALALAKKVTQGGKKEQEAYLSFLKGGSSQDPIDLLLQAGVDMRTSTPVYQAIDLFDQLVEELAVELNNC